MEGLQVFLGVAALLAAKFLVYAWYFRLLCRRWNVSRNPWLLALARMALGAAIAAAVWILFPGDGGRSGFLPTYFAVLAVGRVLAWGAILGFVFGRNSTPIALAGAIAIGVVLSYAVEIPIAIGWVNAIGGIC